MHEFELLPTEEQMRDMVREFRQVEMRRDIMAGGICSPHGKDEQKLTKDSGSCDGNINKIELCDRERNQNCDIDIGEQDSKCGDKQNIKHNDIHNVDDYLHKNICTHHNATACTRAVVAKLQKAFYLQCDIEQALKRLHSVAPPIYRQEIGELIKTKRSNTQQLLSVYSELIGDVVSYAPNLYNGHNFCKTLLELCTMQEKLLNCLIGTEECTGALWLVSREIVVATTLTRMSIFCLFNR